MWGYICAVVVLCAAATSADRVKGTFEAVDFTGFKLKYKKQYSAGEEQTRYNNYLETLNFINQHNKEYDQGKHTFYCGINSYSDLSEAEWKSLTGYIHDPRESMMPVRIPEEGELPKEMDWRKNGTVGPVLDQGMCGSCWAFGSTGSLEGQTMIHKKKLPATAQQQLVSCDKESLGCGGGNPFQAYQYIKTNKGIVNETYYPYTAKNDKCNVTKEKNATMFVASVVGGVMVKPGEHNLEEAVANQGPIQVSVNAALKTWHSYSGGVYNDPKCTDHRDHSVLCVGYGKLAAENGHGHHKMWIIKNSWNTSWGVKGYMYMARGTHGMPTGMCGLAAQPNYPTV